jgi:hypothetical protein
VAILFHAGPRDVKTTSLILPRTVTPKEVADSVWHPMKHSCPKLTRWFYSNAASEASDDSVQADLIPKLERYADSRHALNCLIWITLASWMFFLNASCNRRGLRDDRTDLDTCEVDGCDTPRHQMTHFSLYVDNIDSIDRVLFGFFKSWVWNDGFFLLGNASVSNLARFGHVRTSFVPLKKTRAKLLILYYVISCAWFECFAFFQKRVACTNEGEVLRPTRCGGIAVLLI